MTSSAKPIRRPSRLATYLSPFKFRFFLGKKAPRISRILDVGCGNRSAAWTKIWFPDATYVGVDKEVYNNNAEDFALMDRFVRADLEIDTLDSIEDDSFDLIFLSHVIEHLNHGGEAVRRLARKLRPGGYFYIECPSERSLHLPSGVDCLNFHDDPTHVRIYDLAAVCTQAGLQVVQSRIRREWIRVLLGVTVYLPKQISSLIRHRKLYGPTVWDMLGFAKYSIARKPLSS